MKKNHKKCQNWVNIYLFVFFSLFLSLHNPTMIRAEVNNSTDEYETISLQEANIDNNHSDSADLFTEGPESSLPSETNSDNEVIGEGLPEKDMIVGGDSLTEEQNVTRLSGESIEDIHKVNTFDELKAAIENAGNKQTTIKIMESFTLTEALTIGQDQDITLTADNDQVKEKWQPIERPADYADQGEAKQREIIEEGRRRGEEALEKANLEANPLPSEDKNKIIKRAKEFVEDTLFKVFGKLTLGTDNSAIYIDGNGDEARTKFDNRGSVIDVNGELVMKNAVIMNSYNSHGYTAPIRVNDGGEFTMEGGRITKNTSFEQVDLYYTRPTAAGAVYVKPGGTFTMTNGLIDNNHGGLTGGVFAGDLFGSEKHPAEVTINGGIIAKNESRTGYQMGGGLNGFPKSKLTITDGIIAGNKSSGPGGGVGISSQYIGSPSNVLGAEKASVNRNYKEFIKTNKAEAIIDGGLIYENRAGTSGGGVYLDSNDVNFGRTMVLDNRASQFGGGIYASFPPITQKLENILITENRALGGVTSSIIGGSNGGGLWNCPTGFVHIGDGHSVYVYNNDSGSYGKDITFSEKTWYFNLNDVNIKDEFYSHISPVTKEKNIMKFLEDGPNKEKGVEIPDRLSYHSLYTHLKSIYSQNLIEEAWRNSQTFVLGNQANNGGGFGSNANVTTPKDEGEYGIEVNKKWDDRIEKHTIPMEIKADLFIVPLDKDEKYVKSNYGKDNSLFKYGEITLSEDNNWHSRFDTNYFNGANKEEILKKLEINNFSDIGLPDDAYQMDRGLPFTAEELAERGYKYLVLEQGDRYFVEYDEEKPAKEKTEKAGVLEVFREYHKEQDKGFPSEDKDIYLYLYDPEKQTLTRIDQTTICEDEDTPGVGKAAFAHPLLLKKVSEFKYYGVNRKFTENEGWGNVKGYHNENRGYAFVLTENKNGTLTIEIPYLWLNDYNKNVGFSARQLDNTQDYIVKGNKTHSFTLTNSPWGQLDVEKSWKNIKEKDQPKSMDFYVLLDGKRVVDSYDDKGNPIYKKLTLKAEDDWKGSLDKLDPKSLAAGRYSLEEDSDIFAPEFINKKQKFTIRIGYADNFHEEGQADNHVTATNNHFRSYIYKNEDGTMKGIKMNLYLDGKKVDSKEFTFTVDYMPEVDFTYYYLKDNVVFKELEVETFGQAIPVKYYDLISNEPGLYEYNFYLKRDESGAYALYLPRLVINGVPYADLFIAEKLEPNPPYDSHERINSILPLESKDDWQIEVENHQGPTHEIEILKQWIGGESKVPDEITVVITNEKNEVQKIKLTKEGNWQKTLDNLEGTLRHKGYSIKEVEVPGFTGEIKTEKAGLKITSKDKNGQEIILNYIDDELKTVLKDGNYRYEVFELEDNDLDFSDENRESFITLEKQNDGRYVIRYANGIKLTEILTFKLTNKHIPSRDLHVTKAWNLVGTEHPVEAIEVELYRNGEATGQTLTLSASNEWQGMFTNLPIGNPTDSTEYQYTVKEVGEVKGRIQFGERQFDVTYTGSMGGGLMITNQEIERTRDLHVTKAWNLVGTEHPVETIEVELYRNGEATGQTLTLSASNEWQGMFTNLPIVNPTDSTEYQYTVKEVGEVKGRIQFGERQFDVTYTGTMADGFTITNKEKPNTPPDIPEEPGKPEEPPTPPETPKEPPVPEIPRKQLPPTGENILLNLIATYMIIIGSLVLLIVVSRNKKFV